MMSLFKSACAQFALSVLLEADLAHAFQWTLPPLTHPSRIQWYPFISAFKHDKGTEEESEPNNLNVDNIIILIS